MKVKNINMLTFRGMIAAATPPAECGPAIIAAPARGPCVVVHHVSLVPAGTDARGLDRWDAAPTGYGHRASVRAADVFDRMTAQARRGRRPDPLTPGQIAQGRRYRDLIEWLDAGGVKLSSLEGRVSGGTGRDFMDARLSVSAEVDRMRLRIGGGVAMAVRRVRPSDRGENGARPILDLVLVDRVCCGDWTLDMVLDSHKWSRRGGHRQALLAALSGALDRMIGYFPKNAG